MTQTDNVQIPKVNKRNYGVDAFRLLAMFLVTILHVLGQGGVLSHAAGAAYGVSWLMETMAYCAVNCFGIISGYVGFTEKKKPYRFTKYISVWLQVVFYSFGIRLFYYMLQPDLMVDRSLIDALFPISTYHYWYMSAYTGLFFIIPWINDFVRQCSKEEMNRLMFVLFLVFSCYANFVRSEADVFRLGNGYSFVWLVILYLIGAWLKKCAVSEWIGAGISWLCILICIVLTWIPIVLFDTNNKILLSYTSPTIVLIAVFLFIIFSKMQFGMTGQRIIAYFAPASLGVYLLHVQKDFWHFFMKERFVAIAEAAVWKIPFLVLAAAGFVFVFCIIVEKIRITLFGLLRMNEFAERIVKRIMEVIVRIYEGKTDTNRER